jgi:ribosomal protein S18 acetylase RimI-like enzyme
LNWTIRPLTPEDAPALLPVRLDALRRHPEAFGADVSEESLETMDRLIGRHPSLTLGGFAGDSMIGVAALVASARVKQRHIGHIYGVYVAPPWRGTGLAKALMAGLIQHATTLGLASLVLSVTRGNGSAERFYRGFGFRSYGIQPRALCVDGVYYDADQMVLDLN